jgi:HK97 family phage portal protein
MGIGSYIRSIFNRGDTVPMDPRKGQTFWVAMPWIPDGLQLTQHQAFEVSAVWACCNLISASIAAAPWYTLEVDRAGRRKNLPNDPLSWMLNVAPNDETVAQALKESWLFQALIYGNSYAEIVPNGAGAPCELWPLLSERMLPPTRDDVGDLVYDYINPQGTQVRLPAKRVFHLRGPSVEGLVGQGAVYAAAKAIATAAAADRFSASYFANAATPSGVLEVAKPLQQKDRDALKLEFAQKQASHRKNGLPLVLDSGMKWQAIANAPKDSQLIEGRQFQIEEIARYFGVPLHFLASPQGSQGYGKNLSEMGHGLINFGLRPWTKRLEQEAQVKLIASRSQKTTVIDLSYLSRGTEKEAAEADEIRVRSGIATINECREALGWNHGPSELDHHLVLTTMQPIEKALAPSPPPVTPGAPQAPNTPKTGGGADPEGDGPEGGQLGTAPAAATRKTASVLLTKALADHARRWQARRADLARSFPAAQLPRYLDHARAELRGRVGLDAAELCEAVENGADPALVAHQYLGPEATP